MTVGGKTTKYKTINEAVAEAPVASYAEGKAGSDAELAKIKLLANTKGGFDVGVETGSLDTWKIQNIEIDLNGKTLTLGEPLVGSTGTKTSGIRVLAYSKLSLKNGKVSGLDSGALRGLQNYGEAVVEDVVFEEMGSTYDTIGNFGSLELKGETVVPNGSETAILNSTYLYSDDSQVPVKLKIEEATVKVGKIKVDMAEYTHEQTGVTNESNPEITISDGEIEEIFSEGGDKELVGGVTGGIFDNEVPNNMCASGYRPAAADEAGKYTVKKRVSTGGGSSSSTITYTVKFETNGGSKVEKVKVDKNDTISEPDAPLKDGYTFGGWYTNEACTEEYDFDMKVTKSFTLYAKWIENKVEEPDWENPFIDVSEEDWFYDSVKFVNQKGLFKGLSSVEFGPKVSMTRGMLVTVLYRLAGADTNSESLFDDVAEGMYYSAPIAWAAEKGIVNGVGDNKFAPDALITREQLATIMFRYMEAMGIDLPALLIEYPEYNDANEISSYAIGSIRIMRNTGLMEGKNDNNFDPKGTALRCEVATLLMRFVNKI